MRITVFTPFGAAHTYGLAGAAAPSKVDPKGQPSGARIVRRRLSRAASAALALSPS